MGLLSGSTRLTWPETKKANKCLKRHGISQFLKLYGKFYDLKRKHFQWGDETEYTFLKLDHGREMAQVSLRQKEVISIINDNPDQQTGWRPEYSGYQIEGVPGEAFGESMEDFCGIEQNMKRRREQLMKILVEHDETIMTIAVFPRLGCPEFSFPSYCNNPKENVESRSVFYPDQVITEVHPRFAMMTRYARKRRGHKLSINVPIFKDSETPQPFIEEFMNVLNDDCERETKIDHIYMDSVGFGFGCSCLQATVQPRCLDEARYIYDQFAVLSPIMMSLSAAGPIYRGYLSDIDCRWGVLEQALDDRTDEERGEKPLKKSASVIPKSRFGSIGCFISSSGAIYNDNEVVHDKAIYEKLLEEGVDELIAQHISHIFIRDVLCITKEDLTPRDEKDMNQFLSIYHSVWQTVRLKLPSTSGDSGWKVEMRSCDVQLTDFENAALVTFMVLLCRAMLYYDIDFLIPLSLVDENIKEAQKRDSVIMGRFHFRKSLEKNMTDKMTIKSIYDSCDKMTVDEIINGKEGGFLGLVPLINSFLDSGVVKFGQETRKNIHRYLQLIRDRASGKLPTTARWMREFVQSHPEYKKDSVVTDKINYDLMVACDKISRG